MKNSYIILILLIIFTGCCQNEIIQTSFLSESEKHIIPYTSFQNLNFVDDEGTIFTATTSPAENEIITEYVYPHGCEQKEVEILKSSLSIPLKDLNINIELRADDRNSLSVLNSTYPYGYACQSSYDYHIQELYMDITLYEFEFKNVILFEDCSVGGEVERIIYSTTNGIEFIELTYGRWLKLSF